MSFSQTSLSRPAPPPPSDGINHGGHHSDDIDGRCSTTPDTRKKGYSRLAAAMAWDPAMSAFPRFRESNAFNLLCLQAEIRLVEDELEDTIIADNSSPNSEEVRQYSCNVDVLKTHGRDSQQWKLCLELRRLLKEYNETLMINIHLNDESSPTNYDYSSLQEWLNSSKGGSRDLRGAGSQTYLPAEHGGSTVDDLILLNRKSYHSEHFRMVMNPVLSFLNKKTSLSFAKSRTFLPSEHTTSTPTHAMLGTSQSLISLGDKLVAILAPTLILVPVVILHFIHNSNWRLFTIVLSTLVFSWACLIFSPAIKRSEVFAASAAFVAVQVVYVGSAV